MVSIHAVNTMQFLKDLPRSITIEELKVILERFSKLIDNKSIHPLSERYRSLNIYLNSNLNKKELIEELEKYGKNGKNTKFKMSIRKEVINNIITKASGKKTKNKKIKKKQTKRRSIKNKQKRRNKI